MQVNYLYNTNCIFSFISGITIKLTRFLFKSEYFTRCALIGYMVSVLDIYSVSIMDLYINMTYRYILIT